MTCGQHTRGGQPKPPRPFAGRAGCYLDLCRRRSHARQPQSAARVLRLASSYPSSELRALTDDESCQGLKPRVSGVEGCRKYLAHELLGQLARGAGVEFERVREDVEEGDHAPERLNSAWTSAPDTALCRPDTALGSLRVGRRGQRPGTRARCRTTRSACLQQQRRHVSGVVWLDERVARGAWMSVLEGTRKGQRRCMLDGIAGSSMDECDG